MKGIIRSVKRLSGKYESGCEYWIYTKDIRVNPQWRKTRIGKCKLTGKPEYWYRTGGFASYIIPDKIFNLIDGYSSVRIAEIKGIGKVPVYFTD